MLSLRTKINVGPLTRDLQSFPVCLFLFIPCVENIACKQSYFQIVIFSFSPISIFNVTAFIIIALHAVEVISLQQWDNSKMNINVHDELGF